MRVYVISRDRDEDNSYWTAANGGGWVYLPHADVFTQEEKARLDLPMDGKWVELPAKLMRFYVIGAMASSSEEDDPSLWWNNDSGWGCLETADVFNQEERDQLNLPMDGKWVELPRRKV